LVSKLEAVNTAERDVARFIKDDLSQRLNLSFSNYVVREYPEIVSNKDQATAAAEANQAAIIVWGNYTTDFIELNIQVGDLTGFEDIVINRNDIEGRRQTYAFALKTKDRNPSYRQLFPP